MIKFKRLSILAAAAALSIGVSGCGEKPAVTVYKQGQYQGKPDTQPWNSPEFKNDKVAWENAIKTRTNGQNEYVRIGN